MSRWWFILVVVLTLCGTPASATAEARIFPETGIAIDEPFRSYWEAHGGLPLFGFPISPVLDEPGEDGISRPVQYFERARFEHHPDAAPSGQVQLGRLGLLSLLARGIDWQALPSHGTQVGCQFFAATRQSLCAPFSDFWAHNGGLPMFGVPLTPAQEEVSPTDGQPYVVQYFERARFEYHPEHPLPNRVQLGLLGREHYGKSSVGLPMRDQVQQVIELVNGVRREAALPLLRTSPRLMQIAGQYSEVLAAQGAIAHMGPDGSGPGDRLTRGGYAWAIYAENLAAGMSTAVEVVSGWLQSPAHRANLLDPRLTEVGVGWSHRANDPGQFGDYWVLEGARPR